MTDDALTLTVLREIRDEIRTTNVRLGRVETAILDLAEQQSFVVRWLRAGTRRDRRLEEDIVKLTARVDAVEARLPAVEE